jgi:hypothetical protein
MEMRETINFASSAMTSLSLDSTSHNSALSSVTLDTISRVTTRVEDAMSLALTAKGPPQDAQLVALTTLTTCQSSGTISVSTNVHKVQPLSRTLASLASRHALLAKEPSTSVNLVMEHPLPSSRMENQVRILDLFQTVSVTPIVLLEPFSRLTKLTASIAKQTVV